MARGTAHHSLLLVAGLGLTGCPPSEPVQDADIRHGCPSLHDPEAALGDPIDGDDYETFAAPFLARFCTRCHSTALAGDDRNGAPDDLSWDDEAIVRENLDIIRRAVGVLNYMPPHDPTPSCAERQRMVRWIDAGAP